MPTGTFFLIGPLRKGSFCNPSILFLAGWPRVGALFVCQKGPFSYFAQRHTICYAVVLRVIIRGGVKARVSIWCSMGRLPEAISDCWEFSLGNGSALCQQSTFLNCPLFHLLASIHTPALCTQISIYLDNDMIFHLPDHLRIASGRLKYLPSSANPFLQ